VIITRHGKPVVEFKPIPAPPEPVSEADLDWLRRHRLQPDRGIVEDAGSLLSRMRDEDAH
jgi:antitoxin (DNA-binding transcriptional repressor) of toxin-antitoxin stability system